MRPVLLIGLLLVVCLQAAVAQFSFTPYVGVEKSKTALLYNNQPDMALCANPFSPQAGIRMDYKFKQNHGPFLGIATSRSVVAIDFSNPETALTHFTASRSFTQLRFEGGYMFSTKPLYFKSAPSKASNLKKEMEATQVTNIRQRKCDFSYSATNTHQHHKAAKNVQPATINRKNSRLNVRLQPFAGMALLPSPLTDIISNEQGGETVHSYRAGNWNTAFITGMGFEFAKGRKKVLTVSLQYLAGIGNLDKTELTTFSGNKTTLTTLDSKASAWNLTIGVPVALNKKETVKKTTTHKKSHHRCVYKYRALSL